MIMTVKMMVKQRRRIVCLREEKTFTNARTEDGKGAIICTEATGNAVIVRYMLVLIVM